MREGYFGTFPTNCNYSIFKISKWFYSVISMLCPRRFILVEFVCMYLMYIRHPTVCTQQNIFEKTCIKIVVNTFTFPLAPFAPILVNSLRHSVSLNYVRKSTNRCFRRKMLSILEFLRMFKDSLCRE